MSRSVVADLVSKLVLDGKDFLESMLKNTRNFDGSLRIYSKIWDHLVCSEDITKCVVLIQSLINNFIVCCTIFYLDLTPANR